MCVYMRVRVLDKCAANARAHFHVSISRVVTTYHRSRRYNLRLRERTHHTLINRQQDALVAFVCVLLQSFNHCAGCRRPVREGSREVAAGMYMSMEQVMYAHP